MPHQRRWNSTQASSSSAAATTKAEIKPDPELTETPHFVVPPLRRPLGIDVPPKPSPRTYEKKSDKLFDTERTRAERKVLCVGLSDKGRMPVHRLMAGWRRPVEATSTIIIGRARPEGSSGSRRRCSFAKMCVVQGSRLRSRAVCSAFWRGLELIVQKALYFPNIAGTSLVGDRACTTDLLRGKTSLVTISSTRLSEVRQRFSYWECRANVQEHIESFVRATLDDQKAVEDSQLNSVQVRPGDLLVRPVHEALTHRSITRRTSSKLPCCPSSRQA